MSEPSRQEVESQWQGIIQGTLTREEAHSWTIRWVEDFEGVEHVDDAIVRIALLSLHGFDLSARPDKRNLVHHGIAPGRVYLRSIADIAHEFERWHADTRAFDEDPAAWHQARLETLHRNLVAEGSLDVARRLKLRHPELGSIDET